MLYYHLMHGHVCFLICIDRVMINGANAYDSMK